MPCYDTYCSRPATKVTATDKKVRVEILFVPKGWIHAERSYHIVYLIRYEVSSLSGAVASQQKSCNQQHDWAFRRVSCATPEHTRLFWAHLWLWCLLKSFKMEVTTKGSTLRDADGNLLKLSPDLWPYSHGLMQPCLWVFSLLCVTEIMTYQNPNCMNVRQRQRVQEHGENNDTADKNPADVTRWWQSNLSLVWRRGHRTAALAMDANNQQHCSTDGSEHSWPPPS